MKKKLLLLILVIFLFSPMLFAVEVSGTWYWATDDWNVKYFRYQLDGQYGDAWTVLDSNIYSITINNLDGDQQHTLYVEQSYDGKTWSVPAEATSDIYEVQDTDWDSNTIDDTNFADDFQDSIGEDWPERDADITSDEIVNSEEEVITTPSEKIKQDIKTENERVLPPYLKRNEIGISFYYENSINEDPVIQDVFSTIDFRGISTFGLVKDNLGIGYQLSVGAVAPLLDFKNIKFLFQEGPMLTIYLGSDLNFNTKLLFQQIIDLDFSKVEYAGLIEVGAGLKLYNQLFVYGTLIGIYIPKETQQKICISLSLGYSF